MRTHQRHLAIIVTICSLIVAWSLPATVQAGGVGTGPGGVSNTDGAGSLRLWLAGDAGVYSDTGCSTAAGNGGAVACWADQSGSGNSPGQGNSSSRPIYATAALNGRPVLQFNGSSHYLDKSYTSDLNAASFSLYVVARTTSGSNYRAPFASRCGTDNATRGGYNLYANPTNGWEFWIWWPDGNQWSYTLPPADLTSAWHIVTGQYNRSSLWQGLGIDQPPTSAQTGRTNRANSGCPTRIGAGGTESASPGAYFPGEIAEVIYLNVPVNSAQDILIQNYLAAKYNLTLKGTYNDKYTGNDAAYVRNVAGIGTEGSSGYSDEAHSAGLILRNGGFLQNAGDYLLTGHAAPVIDTTTDDLPTSGAGWGSGDDLRWSRVWYLSKTDANNNGGLVNIAFDFSEAGMAVGPAAAAGNYRLLKRSGTSGAFAEIAQATSIAAGDQVTFNGVNATLLDGYVTLGVVDTASVTKAIGGPGAYSFGSTQVAVAIDAGNTGSLAQLTVAEATGDHAGHTGALGGAGVGWGEFWALTPNAGANGFNVSLTLPALSTPDTNSKVCRYVSGGPWDCAADSFDAVGKTITRNGVTGFSEWAVGYGIVPAVAPAVNASQEITKVVLSWVDSAANAGGYIIWHSESPYVQAGDPAAQSVTRPAGSADWTHQAAAGDPAHNHYYIVQGVNGAGERSGSSNRTGVFSFSMTPGAP